MLEVLQQFPDMLNTQIDFSDERTETCEVSTDYEWLEMLCTEMFKKVRICLEVESADSKSAESVESVLIELQRAIKEKLVKLGEHTGFNVEKVLEKGLEEVNNYSLVNQTNLDASVDVSVVDYEQPNQSFFDRITA